MSGHVSGAKVCAFTPCTERPSDHLRVPLCGRHARKTYEQVRDLLDVDALSRIVPRYRDQAPPRPRLKWSETVGTIYFAEVGELIKIGWTSRDPRLRIKEDDIRGDRVLATTVGTQDDERAHHFRFGHLWERREYFRPGPDLLAYIEELAA